MSIKKIRISDDLSLPLDAATETFGIFGRRGSGKSHTGSVLAEEMLDHSIPIIAYDPTGAWYGLKSSKDGKSGGYPVVIFGGEHADVPLDEKDGGMIASSIVAQRFPAILDVSLMRKGARLRFMADFLESLYHENRQAVHLFCDELQTIAPLQLRNVGEAAIYQSRCVGAIEDIILQGRRRGIGMTGLSQRPALINASVRSQFGTLVAFQIVAPLDRKAIQDWIAEKGDDEGGRKLLASLPSLKKGEGMLWSPTFDIEPQAVHVRDRRTFDSGRTPGVGEKRVEPQKWAEIDVNALGAAIAAKRQEKIDNDPKRLAAELNRLKSELAKAKTTPAPAPEPKVKEVQILGDAHVKRLEKMAEQLSTQGVKYVETGEKMLAEAAALRQTITSATARMAGQSAPVITRTAQNITRSPQNITPRAPIITRPRANITSDGTISPRQQRMLNAAATLATLGVEVSRETVCGWLGIHPRGGSVGEELKALQENGLIDHDRGNIVVTDAGMTAAEQLDASQAIDHAKSGLSPRQRRIFDIIVTAHPNTTTREAIAEQMQIHPRGGSFGEDLGRLAGRGLIEGRRGEYRARDFLFAGV